MLCVNHCFGARCQFRGALISTHDLEANLPYHLRFWHKMVGGCEMQYWPGDRTVSATDPDEDAAEKAESASRSEKVFKFSHSGFSAESIAVRLISSFPRWYMARCLFTDKMPGGAGLLSLGVNKGLRRAMTLSDMVMRGGKDFCESLIRATDDLDRTRMHAQRALLRSIAYLLDFDPFWGLVFLRMFVFCIAKILISPAGNWADLMLNGIRPSRAAYGAFSGRVRWARFLEQHPVIPPYRVLGPNSKPRANSAHAPYVAILSQ